MEHEKTYGKQELSGPKTSSKTLLSCQDAAARSVDILEAVNLRAAKQDFRDTAEPLRSIDAAMSRFILPEGCRPVAYVNLGFCFCFNLLANVNDDVRNSCFFLPFVRKYFAVLLSIYGKRTGNSNSNSNSNSSSLSQILSILLLVRTRVSMRFRFLIILVFGEEFIYK
uniref:Uncharacterized protein n=1 Tax=Glossina pallidipes TaxID=7398 RepID=A0A1B0A7C3_GLOPL